MDPKQQLSQLKTLCQQAERLRDIAETLCRELDERIRAQRTGRAPLRERRNNDRRQQDRRRRA